MLWSLVSAVLAVTAITACGRQSQPAPASAREIEACDITLLALRADTSDERPWRLWTHEPIGRNEQWRSADVLLQPQWYGLSRSGQAVLAAGPSPAMAAAMADTAPVVGVMCANVRRAGVEADIKFANAAKPDPVDPDGEFARADVMIERAVISPDGREAVVYLGQQHAPLSGLGQLILFRKSTSGRWTESARMGVWVS